jgi:hypothetical protein
MTLPTGVYSTSASVTGVGSTAAIVPCPPSAGASGGDPSQLLATILCFVTGTVSAYNIEVTGDDTSAAGYATATQNWQALGSNYIGLSASITVPLGAVVTAVRARITGGTGTVLLQFVQWTR